MPEPSATAQPFQEAIDFFRAKVKLPSKAWTDLYEEQHTLGFMVSGAVKAGVVEDFSTAIARALEKGTTLETFRKDFDAIVARHGWSYKGKRGWRSRIIYETNLRTAYAAGRWEQIERSKKLRPFLRYVSVDDDRTRHTHKSWHGLVYPVDHEFWNSHYPPNGWGCRCTVQSLSARDIKKKKYSVSSAMPPEGNVSRNIKRGGRITQVEVPAGIDPGFAYNAGRNRLSGITPPPAPGTPGPGIGPAAKTPMPAPRSFNAKRLMTGKGLGEEDYVRAFLKEFRTDFGKHRVFIDKAGEALPISEELFRDFRGDWKIMKSGRQKFVRMLAASIKEPDEIWFDWHQENNGVYRLRRRYISRFRVAGEQKAAYTVFEVTRDGWREVTNFTPNHNQSASRQDDYINQYRTGHMVYRRKD